MVEDKEPVWHWPIRGVAFFVSSPRLWWRPLFTVMAAFLLMAALFGYVFYRSWPSAELSWYLYTWTAVKAFGYATASALAVWVFILPLGLSFGFEGMIRQIFAQKNSPIAEEKLFKSIHSTGYVLIHTLGWRIFWPLMTLIGTLTLGPVGFIIGQIGLGHITAIDGFDLALSLKGYSGGKRLDAMSKYRAKLLQIGFLGGMLSALLGLTVIGWIFWLPGMFSGMALWISFWPPLSYESSKKEVL